MVGLKILVTTSVVVFSPLLLIANILTKGGLWNYSMSQAFLPAARKNDLKDTYFKSCVDDLKTMINQVKNEYPEGGSEYNMRIPSKDVSGKDIELSATFIGNKNDLSKPTVIYFCANLAHCEYSNNMVRRYMNVDCNCNILLFNYRSVGLSSGKPPKCAQDIIDDGKTIMEYVTNTMKIPQNNVILEGKCMGAAVATMIAKDYPRAHLKNKNSFTKWSDAAKVVVNKVSYLGFFVKIITDKSKWDLDVLGAWNKRELNPNKGFTLFQTAGSDEILTKDVRIGVKIFAESRVETEAGTKDEHSIYESMTHEGFDPADKAENIEDIKKINTAQLQFIQKVRDEIQSEIEKRPLTYEEQQILRTMKNDKQLNYSTLTEYIKISPMDIDSYETSESHKWHLAMMLKKPYLNDCKKFLDLSVLNRNLSLFEKAEKEILKEFFNMDLIKEILASHSDLAKEFPDLDSARMSVWLLES